MLFSSWLRNGKRPAPAARRRGQTFPRQRVSFRPLLEALEDRLTPSATGFLQTNLVSDDPTAAHAQVTDPNLVNPWGLSVSPTGDWWVANEGTGTSTLYNTSQTKVSVNSLVVNIPANPNGGLLPIHNSPTGTVYHDPNAGGFNVSENGNTGSSAFLFATIDGTISGWNPSVDHNNAIIGATSSGAAYLGLAIGTDSNNVTRLYASDFAGGKIDVYDQNFNLVTLTGNFTDPNGLPQGYSPFNIQAIGDKLYVEYAPAGKVLSGQQAAGDGAVDVYNLDGTFSQRLVSPGDPHINDPWAIAMAPSNFGSFSNDVVIGNFGDGTINAFDPTTGAWAGEMTGPDGQPIVIPHLWALSFGNGGAAGPTNTLYFTAGLTSHLAPSTAPFHGLFGSLQAMPPAAGEAMTAHGNAPVSAGAAMTVHGNAPVSVSNNSVAMPSSPPNAGSGQDQGIESLSLMSNSMTMTPASALQALEQRIDAFFQSVNATLASLESRLEMMDPQLSPFFSIYNADLDALEATIGKM